MIFPKKPQILYAPMLGTFGGGSMRSFGRGTGGSIEFLDRTTDFPGAQSSIQQHGNHTYTVTTQTHVLWMGVTSGGGGGTATFSSYFGSGGHLQQFATTFSGRTINTSSHSFKGGAGGMGGNSFVIQIVLPAGTSTYRFHSGNYGSGSGNYQNAYGRNSSPAVFEISSDGQNYTTILEVPGGHGGIPGWVLKDDYPVVTAPVDGVSSFITPHITSGYEDYIYVHSLGSGGRFDTTDSASGENSAGSNYGGTAGAFVDITNKVAYSAPDGYNGSNGQSFTRYIGGLNFGSSGSHFATSGTTNAIIGGNGGYSIPGHNGGAGGAGYAPSGAGGAGGFYQPGANGARGTYAIVTN